MERMNPVLDNVLIDWAVLGFYFFNDGRVVF